MNFPRCRSLPVPEMVKDTFPHHCKGSAMSQMTHNPSHYSHFHDSEMTNYVWEWQRLPEWQVLEVKLAVVFVFALVKIEL